MSLWNPDSSSSLSHPVDSLNNEDTLRGSSNTREVKWFKKRTSTYRRKVLTSRQCSKSSESCDKIIGTREQCHYLIDSSSDDEDSGACKSNWCEKPSRYVSQEELDALKGCVMRRRAVFSPSPSSSPLHSCGNNLHLNDTHAAIEAEKVDSFMHVRQGSLEYDHLKDFNPSVSMKSVPDSISVQFRVPMCDETENKFHEGFQPRNSTVNENCSTEAAERLGVSNCCCRSGGCQNCDSHDVHDNDFPHSQFSCRGCNCDLSKQSKGADAVSLFGKTQPHFSPFNSKYNSPLLSKHQLSTSEGNIGYLKANDTGSSYSLYSQATTVSSLADRPHRSYSKGVDGNLFKDRTDVTSLINFNLLFDIFYMCIQKVLAWFSEFSDQQRNMMLMKLLVRRNLGLCVLLL